MYESIQEDTHLPPWGGGEKLLGGLTTKQFVFFQFINAHDGQEDTHWFVDILNIMFISLQVGWILPTNS